MAIGYSLVSFGGLGFFGTALVALGGFPWLQPTFEWPVGRARGVLVMPSGERVVPLKTASRIQVYDSAGRFLRGWQVGASGGAFILRLDESKKIEVLTSRGDRRYLYSLDGELLSQDTYAPGRYSEFYEKGEPLSIPTHWWLWMLTSPFHSWIVAALGGILLFLNGRK